MPHKHITPSFYLKMMIVHFLFVFFRIFWLKCKPIVFFLQTKIGIKKYVIKKYEKKIIKKKKIFKKKKMCKKKKKTIIDISDTITTEAGSRIVPIKESQNVHCFETWN